MTDEDRRIEQDEMVKSSAELADIISIIYPGNSGDEDYGKLITKGGFSSAELEYLLREYLLSLDYPLSDQPDRTEVWARQNKSLSMKRLKKAGVTLLLAALMSDAFKVEDWKEIMPTLLLTGLCRVAVSRGGLPTGALIVNAVQEGFDKFHDNCPNDPKVKVNISLASGSDPSATYSYEITERAARVVLDQLKKKRVGRGSDEI